MANARLAATTGKAAAVSVAVGRAGVHVAGRRAHYRQPMFDSSAAELLAQLNRAYCRHSLLTISLAVLLGVLLVEGIVLESSLAAAAVFGTVAVFGLWLVHLRENDYYSEPVDYVLDDETAQAYRRLLRAFQQLTVAGPVWRVFGKGKAADGRRILRRHLVIPKLALPPRVKSNIRVPKLACGRQALYFFPDRLLVYDAQMVWGVFYYDLQTKAGDLRSLPEYAGGGAATELKGFLALVSDAGLSEIFQCPDPAVAVEVAAALEGLG